jgi:2,5-furandicarboxylate decarboxylase 1
MRDQSLRTHLANLEQQGELIRFAAAIDPDATMSAVSWRSFAERGKGCLFTNVTGHPGWRAASQIIADRGKWAVALGVTEAEVVPTLAERIAKPVPTVEVGRDQAPCKEVVLIGEQVDLTKLPAMWTSERDPGRYIASGMCIIKDPETGIRNVSFHRAQLLGPDRTGFLICPRQALRIYQMYGQRGRPMEVAMVVGAHPLISFAGAFVAPYGVDELTIAGGLLGDPVRMVKCETLDLEVPADAELILEGEIIPGETTEEGPFGEVTGTYAQEGSTPLFRIKAVTHRRDPIFYAMQCGLPPSDAHSIICTTIEMKLWEHLRGADAGELELLDVRCIGSMTPMMVVVQLRQRHAGQAKAALMAVLSSPYLHPKFAVAVDEDVDPSDVDQIMWAIATRSHAARDVQRWDATRVFALDNASPIEPGMSPMYRVGTKMLIDATRPPMAQAAERRRFDAALPPGHDQVRLADDQGQTRPAGSDRMPEDAAAAQSIRPVLHARDQAGALATISQTVEPRAELAALTWQVGSDRQRAVLFESVAGHVGWRVASRLLADRAGWASAFGLPESELLFALRERLKTKLPPVEVSAAPVGAVSARGDTLDLGRLPAPLWGAGDAGPRLLAVALARDPDSGRVLLSLTDHQLLARDRLSFGALAPALRALCARMRASGRALPVALVIGGPPALYLAAALAHALPGADLALAGGLLGAPLALAALDGLALPVPAQAELVIGGTLPPDDLCEAGSAGDWSGLYAAPHAEPVLHADCLLERVDPILYAVQTGAPGNELAGLIGLATELVVAEHLRNIEGGLDLLDVRCHPAGGGRVLAVKLRPRVEGQSKTALIGALSSPAPWPKLAIGVDEDVDAADLRDVFWSAASRTHAALDVGMIDGVRAPANDLAAPRDPLTGERVGTRWFIDSTMPPLTQPERRLGFARAIPKSLREVALADFLPPA